MSMIKIVYVGAKLSAIDNIARSGKIWNGKGDVQEVTLTQARALVRYQDQWQLSDPADQAKLDMPVLISTTDDAGTKVTINAEELKQPLERMSAAQLKAFAKERFGKDLPLNRGRKVLLDEVTVLVHGPQNRA